MKHVPLAEIIVPDNRQRREFDPAAIGELAESIARIGLIHPLLVRHDTAGKTVLVAGERRLRAIKQLSTLAKGYKCNGSDVLPGWAGCLSLTEVDPTTAFEAELEENIRRLDLSWQEKAEAVAKMAELRQAQGRPATAGAIAQEVFGRSDGYYQGTVQEQIQVAKHLDDPDVARAKSARDAFKIMLRKESERENEKRAAMIGPSLSGEHQLLLGDCHEVLATLVPGSFDVICTDPPYGMGADSFGDAAGKLVSITHSYSDDEASFRRLMEGCAGLMTSCAKPAAHLYVCCDIDQFAWLRQLFAAEGWSVFRTPLINYKQGSGRVPLPEHGPRRQWESILYAYRGQKKCTALYSDVIESQADENLGHGAQKPVGLYTNLLRRSVRPGDSVLDPFCGTGTVFAAAHALKCRATGIEREAKYFGIAAKRIEELK